MTTKHHSSHLSDQIQLLEKENKMLRSELFARKNMQERFQDIFNNFKEWYYEITLDGDLAYFSPSICKVSGYSKSELQNKNYRDYTSAEMAKKISQVYNKIYLTGEPAEFIEYEIFGKHGNTIYLEASVYLMRDSNTKPTGFQGFARDITDRKKMEMALQESEEKFRLIFEYAPDAYYLMSADGEIIDVNRITEEIAGYKKHELIGKNFAQTGLLSTEQIIKATDFLTKIVQGKPTDPQEFTLTRKDGTFVEVEIRAYLAKIKNQTVILGIARDVTERKLADETLKRSEEKYRELFEKGSDILYIHDLEGNLIQTNLSFKKVYGWESDDLANLNVLDLIPERYKNKFKNYLNRVLEKGRDEGLMTVLTKEGREIVVEYNNKLIYKGTVPIGVQGSAKDITNRLRNELALRKSEARLKEAQRIAKVGSWQLNLLTDNLTWSDEVFRIFEVNKEHFGASYEAFLSVIHPEDQYAVNNAHAQSTANETPCKITYRLLMPDERIKYVTEEFEPSYNPEGKPVRSIGTIQDITEIKQAEKERENLQKQLYESQKLEAIGILAGGVAHDFNNMLSGIMGYTELVMKEMRPADPLQKKLQAIVDITDRSANLTRQLLAFARKQTIEPVVFDLNESIEAILKMIRRIIGENIELEWLPGAGSYTVMMDPSQLDQIIVNLCVNAGDAITNIGKITIETDIVSIDQAYCASHAEFSPGEYVLLAVSDDGCGMDKKTSDHIFEPFFTTKDSGKGTGMGLPTVYGVVKQNDGFINVYSEPGQGTTIKIYLPLKTDKSIRKKTTSNEIIPHSQGETVLIVEDESSLLEMNLMLLEHLGYVTFSAETPSEAIRIIHEKSKKIDMVITDVIMPEMNGRELLEQLQRIQPEIKHLFMSGYTANIISHQGILDEGVHFIQKPFTLKDLAIKIRTVLIG